MSRILIDGRFVGVGESISRYTLELLREILNLDKENEYTLLVRPQAKSKISNFKPQNYGNLIIKILDIKHYSWSEQTKLLDYLNNEKFDLVHFTQFNHPIRYKGNFIVTIHDLTMIGHLHRQNAIKRMAFNMVMKAAVQNSKRIISISKMTKQDILDYYKTDPKKIEVIYHGIDHERFHSMQYTSVSAGPSPDGDSRIQQFKDRYKIANEYFLYTGMWKKHKNLIRLLKAFEIFSRQNTDNRIQLVLVGKIDPSEPEVLTEVERNNSTYKPVRPPGGLPTTNYPLVVTTGFIDDDELPVAYAGAMAYIIPSLSEGFGWPPLEAMACGVPVISSNLSCMPEILGDAPIYFDPYEIKDIAKAMEKISKDEKLRAELSKKGLAQVKKYNWSDCAEKTLAVYKEALL